MAEEWNGGKSEDEYSNGLPHTANLQKFLSACTHVVVATPPETHFDLVVSCLKAGKKVLCEKPLCTTHHEAQELFKLAEGNLWVSYPHLYHPEVEALSKLDEVNVTCVFAGPTPREPLLDWGPHALSAAFYVLGADAELTGCQVHEGQAQVDLRSPRGKARCLFGHAPNKVTEIRLHTPHECHYLGEKCEPDPLTRMFDEWVGQQQTETQQHEPASSAGPSRRTDPELTLAVHRILDEVLRSDTSFRGAEVSM